MENNNVTRFASDAFQATEALKRPVTIADLEEKYDSERVRYLLHTFQLFVDVRRHFQESGSNVVVDIILRGFDKTHGYVDLAEEGGYLTDDLAHLETMIGRMPENRICELTCCIFRDEQTRNIVYNMKNEKGLLREAFYRIKHSDPFKGFKGITVEFFENDLIYPKSGRRDSFFKYSGKLEDYMNKISKTVIACLEKINLQLNDSSAKKSLIEKLRGSKNVVVKQLPPGYWRGDDPGL